MRSELNNVIQNGEGSGGSAERKLRSALTLLPLFLGRLLNIHLLQRNFGCNFAKLIILFAIFFLGGT